MAENTTRQQFIEHVQQLKRKQTTVPATAWLPGEIISRATGQSYGQSFISYFLEDGFVTEDNPSTGLRGGIHDDIEQWLWLEDFLSDAEKEGDVRYVIGEMKTATAIEKRGDPPGVDFFP